MGETLASIKWQGKVSAKVRGTTEQVWPFLEDFCNLHKWFPAVSRSYKVAGVDGEPGLIRYCEFTTSQGQTIPNWTSEKLLMIDPIQRCLSYEIIQNNMGCNSYVGTWKIIPINGEDEYGCKIEWSFTSGPTDGWKYEDYLGFIESSLQGMVQIIDEILQSTS